MSIVKLERGVGTHSFGIALSQGQLHHVSPVWGLGGLTQTGLDWSTKVLDMAKAVNSGIYNNTVWLTRRYINFSSCFSIWLEFISTLRARLNHIKAKANWWVYRDEV
jgi:hypothetical protein